MNNDLISRKALKKAIKDSGYSHYFEDFFLTKLCEIIDNAPTVNPCENCDLFYQRAVEDAEYCERYEPTYNPNDGSM